MPSATRSVRRLATTLISIGLAALVSSSSVLAVPVAVGYRDHAYGGGATRPAGDKPQSKLWYTDEGGGNVQWWGGMFRFSTSPSVSEFRIYKLSADKTAWNSTTIPIDRRDASHGDYLWDENADTLYVASIPIPNNTNPLVDPATPDDVRIFRYTYNSATDTYTQIGGAGAYKAIAGTATVAPGFRGGAWTVSIDKDSTGRLWVVWPQGTEVRYTYSDDNGETWAAAAQLPAQAGNPINFETLSRSDSASVIAFGSGTKDTVGVMWSDQDNSGATPGADNGYYFATIAAGADPTVGGNWSTTELPKLPNLSNNEADNHINMKTTSDGTVYMVGKTRAETTLCATNKNRPNIPFFRRTPGGTWNTYLVATVGDCDTRPQVVIAEMGGGTPDVAYVFLTTPNGGGAVYRRSAPTSGADAFVFRGPADEIVNRGVPFIKSSTETLIDDASTTKQVVNSNTGIAVISNNLTSSAGGNAKVYLHNFMTLPASDNTAPAGTVSINAGAATTSSQTVSVAVPATDAGTGMSLVRLSNNADMSNSTTYLYTSPISWTLTAGLGTKTVYVEWRDGAGNWSATANDSIELTDDITAPNAPTSVNHRIFGSGRFGIPVRIEWPAATDNAGGSGIKEYRVQRSVNGAPLADYATVPASAAPGLSLDLPNSAITYRFCVRSVDNGDNVSASARCSATFKTVSVSESSAAMRFTGSWSLSNSAVYVGGKARISSTKNSTATVSFRGNRVGWYSRLGPQNGQAKVYIDGSLKKTVNLFSSTTVDRKLVFTYTWSSVGNHSIRIVVNGTSGHPKVVVDQIFYLQ